jgi:PAS domain S-box-containing protein
MQKKLNTLETQLAILTSLCLLGAIALFGGYMAFEQSKAAEDAMKHETKTLAKEISHNASNFLVVDDFISLEESLLSSANLDYLRNIKIVNNSGSVITYVERHADGKVVPRFTNEGENPPKSNQIFFQFSRDNLITWYPIKIDHFFGWVKLTSSLQIIRDKQQAIYIKAAVLGAVAIIISIVVLIAFLKPHLNAIRQLKSFAETLDENLGNQIEMDYGAKEIEALGKALNNVSKRLYTSEASLRENEMRLRSVVEHMPVMLDALDEQNNFIVWNKECERVSGYSAAEIVNNPNAVKLLYPDDQYREQIIKEWAERGDDFNQWEIKIHTKTGQTKFISWTNISKYHPIPGWASWAIGQDITKTKESERLKDELIATVNHELRTPLTAIQGALGLISGSVVGTLPEKVKEMIYIAYNNSKRLTRLIDDMLYVQQAEYGSLQWVKEPLELMQLVLQSVSTNQAYADQQNVEFIIKKKLPDVWVMGDSQKLEQVLNNLLTNAAKYSPPETKVEISVERIHSYIRVTIFDQGPGIPPDFQPRVFEKFTRADSSSTRNKGGTGLGLYIAKQIIDHHNGNIGFISHPGQGTQFYFELPEYLHQDKQGKAPVSEEQS